MRFFGLLLVTLLTSPALAVGPHHPPPLPRREPSASARAPIEERRGVELLGHGRAMTPFLAHGGLRGSPAFGAGVGVGVRISPYFSLGGEGSALRVGGSAPRSLESLELSAVARVYLLETGRVDPYLELALGYASGPSRGGGETTLLGGPSARSGAGLDLVVVSPLRLGAFLGYREVAHLPEADCLIECRARAEGGVVAAITVTLPLGQPL
jgi:hypothetical protein